MAIFMRLRLGSVLVLSLMLVGIVFSENRVNFAPGHQLELREHAGRRRSVKNCTFGVHTLAPGETIPVDDCTTCKCPHHSPRPVCWVRDCRWQPNCLRYDKSRDKCCGVCVKFGCKRSRGTFRVTRIQIANKACRKCICTKAGKIVCNACLKMYV